ncbi:ankyrin repeat-containing domain protein [Xylariaceae sp. FL1272]|nr:ankyrin repeat-containing domain protein [Xylariaceae sp. FL1272]
MRDAPIHMAARIGHIRFIQALVDQSVDVNLAGPFGFTALHIATYQRNTALVRQISRIHNVDVNAQSMSGETALHVAAHNDDLATASVLLSHGASADIRNAADCTPGVVARTTQSCRVWDFFKQQGLPH